ncbi:MAG TPA: hypothetical protein VKM94_15595 [Blastocatellia bacterium]|nr:hypothetical protein [Blastocatellia bacterium]
MKRASLVLLLALSVGVLAIPFSRASARAHARALSSVESGTTPYRRNEPSTTSLTAPQSSKLVLEQHDVRYSGTLSDDVRDRFFGSHSNAAATRSKKRNGARSIEVAAGLQPQIGQPQVLNARSALSAAIATTLGGRDTQFSEVALIADWDGREDCNADRAAKIDDFSGVEVDPDQTLTRTAISEHTIANGFLENVFYYGDSIGNVWVAIDIDGNGTQDQILQINLPTVLNIFGSLMSDDQVTITGLAVNPVADLTSFGYAPLSGVTGEILYVTYHDTEGLRLSTGNQIVRSGLLAFPISDAPSPPAVSPIISDTGFPITVGAAFGIAFSVFSNVAGCAVDDDGSVYFQNVDLIGLGGANIVKVQSLDTPTNQDRSLATATFQLITNLNPPNRRYPDTSGPPTQINRFTNYSGTSTTFGNIVALAIGQCNSLYAAVARSFVAGDDQGTQSTEGLFTNPSALGPTPSMVISFADCSGRLDACSTLPAAPNLGIIPSPDGLADSSDLLIPATPGVNNFRVFVLGNGPDIRSLASTNNIITTFTLKIDMQIDFTAHAGLAVDQNRTVYVISGGEPAGVGKSPSPSLGEILCFEDTCPADRRADFVDLRSDGLPNPPSSGGNVGDGDSDRFDHIYFVAPNDQITLTPTGLSGLATGFLRYTNRLAPNPIGPGVTLGVSIPVQSDDSTDGTILFELLDPGHQVAGGDDQNPPFTGDDDDGQGTPALAEPLSGGFEFVFGGPAGTSGCVWNGFFLNSNGNLTFGEGDTRNTPTVADFRSGPPRIAPAWTDLNPAARSFNSGTFPLQALGFSGVNSFQVRWINVPQSGSEACVGTQSGSTNTFSVTLFDDGTGIDENASQTLNNANPIGNNGGPFDLMEGPNALRFTREPSTGVLVGCALRPEGSGIFVFDYCRMDLIGTLDRSVLTGYSIGGQDPLNPPGLCEINLSEAARAADTNPFGVIQGETASIGCPLCCIGEGTEPTLFELFNEGRVASIRSDGTFEQAAADFDLRAEGNVSALCTPPLQRDLNRDRLCFLGVGCSPRSSPRCQSVLPSAFVTTPTTTGIVNALCSVQINMIGCGFFPNETTLICQNVVSNTGIPIQRPGKSVSTSATLVCDTNGDGVPEATIVMTNVSPLSCNLVRGTLAALGPNLPGTAFPLSCCGGTGVINLTTRFSEGDNNVFGPFTLTTGCPINLGVRAPVLLSATPSSGICGIGNDILLTGACFVIPQGSVTSVFAVQRDNPSNVIQATRFFVLNANLIDAFFQFGTANANKTFLIFVTGPGGTSRNLSSLPAGAPAGCPIGNEEGVRVTFSCIVETGGCIPDVASPGCPCPSGVPPGTNGCTGLDVAIVNGCHLSRGSGGVFALDVFGKNIKRGATIVVGGHAPKRIKFRERDPDFPNGFVRVTLKGGVCKGLPGAIVVTNPSPAPGVPPTPSQPFACAEVCPTT